MPYDDYLAAHWLVVRRRWIWRGVIVYMLFTTPVFFAIVSIGSIVDLEFDALLAAANLVLAMLWAALTLAFIFLWLLWCMPRSARKSFAQMQSEDYATSFNFDAGGIRISNTLGTSDLQWHHVVRWAEDRRLMLLYRTDYMFFVIPKSQVDPAILDALKGALSGAGVSKH